MPTAKFSKFVWVIAATSLIADCALADLPATQPASQATTQPTTQLVDTPAVQEIRQQILDWDVNVPKMSLQDFRKTFYTQNEREAVYADWLAHDTWESSKTEMAVRDKWGPDADTQFARLAGFTTLEEDKICQIQIDGNHATLTWSTDQSKPETLVKVDGHWLTDVHSMFADWLKDDPNMETDRRSLGPMMKQERADIDAGKFDDADSFIADLKNKINNPPAN